MSLFQDSAYLHFLAEDSHPLFNLPVPNTKDIIFEDIKKLPYFLATVTEKQYCMVKKDGTRYRVPIGTKFFRVKVKPFSQKSRTSSTTDAEKSSSSKKEQSEGNNYYSFVH